MFLFVGKQDTDMKKRKNSTSDLERTLLDVYIYLIYNYYLFIY